MAVRQQSSRHDNDNLMRNDECFKLQSRDMVLHPFPIFSTWNPNCTFAVQMSASLCNLSEWCTVYIQWINSNNTSQQPQACSVEGGQASSQCCSPAELVPLTHSRVQAVKDIIDPADRHMGNLITPEKHKAMHRSRRKPTTKLYSHLDLSQWQCQQLECLLWSPPMSETAQRMVMNVGV